MNQPPAFQFYVDNFIEGTSDMSPHEVGCYVRLLCHQWSRGQLPLSDPQKVRRVAGGVVSNEVLGKFPDGKNQRLEKERIKQQVWREKSREGGIKSGLTRASRVVQPPLQPPFQPNGQPNGNIPSPSPDSIKNPLPPLVEEIHSPSMIRLGILFKRRETTRWSKPELKALREIEPIPEEDFQAVEKYYTLTIPKESDFRRHDLVTLLNNWNGEVDRARKFKLAKDYNL